MKHYKVLIVCSANKGRSASYHAHMKHLLKERNITNVKIDSAGVNKPVIDEFHKIGDTGAAPQIVDILNKQGIEEINNHKVKVVSEDIIKDSDIVLTYNTNIRDKIHKDFPDFKDKVVTVRGYITGKEGNLPSEALNVDDAYHPNNGIKYRKKIAPNSYKAYVKVADESKRLAKKTLEKLLK